MRFIDLFVIWCVVFSSTFSSSVLMSLVASLLCVALKCQKKSSLFNSDSFQYIHFELKQSNVISWTTIHDITATNFEYISFDFVRSTCRTIVVLNFTQMHIHLFLTHVKKTYIFACFYLIYILVTTHKLVVVLFFSFYFAFFSLAHSFSPLCSH